MRRLPLLATSLFALALVSPPGGASAQSGDPGVAFVSTLNGNVNVQRGDSGEVESAGINAPLMVGDYVSTAPGSRAEVQFDYGHVVRVGPSSQIRFAELGRRDDTVQLASGSVGVGVLHATSEYTQVETPSVVVRPREAGFYRVSIDPNGVTAITVRSGNAAILLPQGTRWLDPGSTMLVWGPAGRPSFRYVGTRNRDAFDTWNTDRNAAYERANAYRYASSDIPGLYTLADYGQWQTDPDYGNEWIPDVAPDWSPYSSGQWTSEPYYGWTWVDNSPWGYAPSHYGRWHRDHRRNRWAWTPGPRTQSQTWAPALVAFIGFGGGAVVANIGWVALAPNEAPHPWWGSASRNYAAANVPNFQRTYVNAQAPNAVRGMPRQSFANGQYQRIAPVAAANFTHAVVMRSALPVVPETQSLRYTQHAAAPIAHAAPAQAFHAFKATPRAPQTFAQQRTQAAATVQHAPAAAPPERRVPVVQQHPTPAAHPPVAAPAARPAPVVHEARPPVAAPAARPAPVERQARPPVAAPAARPAPVERQARPPVAAPAARPAPVVQPARPPVAAPARPVPARPPAVQQARPPVVTPVRPAPAVQPARPPVVAPVRPAPAVQQPRAPALQQPRAPAVAPVRPAHVAKPVPPPAAVPAPPAPSAKPATEPAH